MTITLAVGCGDAEEGVDHVTANAVSSNALTLNALTLNALTLNALTSNALTLNALTLNALTANELRDPLAREFLKYVVSCAFPTGKDLSFTVEGTRYTFAGQLGLAPTWGKESGKCDGECQRWVSACVLSRVDVDGIERSISIRGEHKALKPTSREKKDYKVREATYFGNVFLPGQPRFLCLSPGATTNERVCGPSMTNCPMTVVGSCEDACQSEGPHGAFRDCSTAGQARRETVYRESITVFLPR